MASTAFRATFLINKSIDEKLVRLEKDYGLNKSDSVRRGVELLHDYLIENVKVRKSKAVELPVEDAPPKPKKRKKSKKSTSPEDGGPDEEDGPWAEGWAERSKPGTTLLPAPDGPSQLCPGEDQRDCGPPSGTIAPTTIATSTEEKAETAP